RRQITGVCPDGLRLLFACFAVLGLASESHAQSISQSEIPIAQAIPGPPGAESTPGAKSEQRLQAQVAELIEQLGDSNYHRREDAKWQLEHIGLAAFEQLRQAAESHPSPQIALTARYL